MSSQSGAERRQERGFSLIEMLVATAVFAIAAAVAFILYSAAQKSYKAGENFTDQQQMTRVAFDRMISDLRLAGFNFNPDGDTTRIDEQVEGAWDTAVTIRGDFDFEDPAAAVSPESALPGTAYTVVSTGNDEIVTYVLGKSGVSETLALRMDVNRPRTKSLQNVTISNVALVQSDPPYTLYRVSLADVATFPSTPPNGTAFLFEPVADNIRSMTFQYYDDGGALISPNTPTNTADDIGGSDANALTRARIRRIAVNLVGMTPDPDPQYTDSSDAIAATQHFRKFDLSSDVNAENLGRAGIKDIDVTPPPAPTGVAVVPGHCQGMLVKVDQPASTAGVSAYAIKYYPSGSPGAFSTQTVTYPHQEYGVLDYDAHGFVAGLAAGTWCFQVQSRDAAGNQSGWAPASSPPCAAVAEASTPAVAQNVAATGNGSIAPLDSAIKVTWSEVKNNSNNVTGDPDQLNGFTILRDLQKYQIVRSDTAAFTTTTTLPAAAPWLGQGTTEFNDAPVANCRDYYYKVQVVDNCNVTSTSSAVVGRATTTIPPAKVIGLTGNRLSRTQIRLEWPPVTTKIDGTMTLVDTYKVYRVITSSSTSPTSIPFSSFVLRGTAPAPSSGNAFYIDTLSDSGSGSDVKLLQANNSAFYVVSAADLCGNEGEKSDVFSISCNFQGNFFPEPPNGGVGDNPTDFALRVVGSQTYIRASLRVPQLADPMADEHVGEQFMTCSGDCTYNLGSHVFTATGSYSAYWEAENDKGCLKTEPTTFTATGNEACQITPTNPNLSPTTGQPANQNKLMSWDIINTSGIDLEIIEMTISWQELLGEHRLREIEFPTGTVVAALIADTPSTTQFLFLPPTILATQNGLCGTCKVNMALEWDTSIKSSTVGEEVTVTYKFQTPTGNTGFCSFKVKPDLTITGP